MKNSIENVRDIVTNEMRNYAENIRSEFKEGDETLEDKNFRIE